MNNYPKLLKNLIDKKPFALARFNDGEMTGVEQVGSVVARGDQQVSKELSDALREALQYEQEEYWVGIPCPVCWPKHYKLADELVRSDYEYKTCAVVLTNRNWKDFVQKFPGMIQDRKVVWISGDDQNLDNLNFSVDQHKFVNTQDAWAEYESVKDYYNEIEEGSIVILSCGPLSRILTRKWFEKRPDLTIIDVGSVWDPFTRNVWHRCHTGQLPHCPGCN